MKPLQANDKYKMKTIIYRGGVVLFDLPNDWTEKDDNESGCAFYRDGKASGIFRVNVTTCSMPKPASFCMIVDMLKASHEKIPGSIFMEKNKNPILVYEKMFWEKWKKCFGRYWQVGNFVSPNYGRIALFSYTVLQKELYNEQVRDDLKMIEESVAFVRFSSAIGHSTVPIPNTALPLN